MTKLYVYHNDSMRVIARIEGDDHKALEQYAYERYNDGEYCYTYSPAFGAIGGLIDCDDAESIKVQS